MSKLKKLVFIYSFTNSTIYPFPSARSAVEAFLHPHGIAAVMVLLVLSKA